MISDTTLLFLVAQKRSDAEALFHKQRFATSIYIMGYAIEIALKRRICQTLKFTDGFPESQNDLLKYINDWDSEIRSLTISKSTFTSIKEIRNHDLNRLLQYSVKETKILLSFATQWSCVSLWNPQLRYRRKHFRKVSAASFISSAKDLIKELA